MKPAIKRVLVLIVGWLFLLVGIAGLFLPIIQGILCIVIGLLILSSEYVWAHNLLQRIKTRFPKIAHVSEEASERAQDWLHRITGRERHSEENESHSEQSKSKTAE